MEGVRKKEDDEKEKEFQCLEVDSKKEHGIQIVDHY